jgi:cytochrome c biogenesis protein CcdA
MLYTLGRTISYVVLGMIIVNGALAIPSVSFFLQNNMNKFLGPILLIVGLFLIGIFKFNISGPGFGMNFQKRIEKTGIIGALILGLLFALSFCPVSAALFFGSLIPIAVEHQSGVFMPFIYGIGTALPVVIVSIFVAFGARFIGSFFNRLTQFEKIARKITGVIFILVGIYYILTYIFKINL